MTALSTSFSLNRVSMKHRGRKSAAELSIATPVESIPRAAPPGQLSDFEASVWQQIVATKPADWFQADTYPLLISYCKHVAHMATVDKLVEARPDVADDDELKRLDLLYKMRDRESKALISLARQMRLTQQSQYCEKTAHSAARKTSTASAKPWES